MFTSALEQEVSKRVKTGLRSKKITTTNKKTNTLVNSSSTNNYTTINVYEKFVDSLISWKLETNDNNDEISIKIKNNYTLPDNYNTAEEYIQCWEPLIIDEIKQSLLSEIEEIRRISNDTMLITPIVNNTPILPQKLINISCTPLLPPSTIQEAAHIQPKPTSNRPKSYDNKPSPMDLLLITYEPLTHPLTVTQIQSKTCMLGIVIARNKEQPQAKDTYDRNKYDASNRDSFQVKVLGQNYDQFKLLSDSNIPQSSSTTTNIPHISQRIICCDNFVDLTVSSSYKQPSSSLSSYTANKYTTASSTSSHIKDTSTTTTPQPPPSQAVTVYYHILTNLSTSWREYLALHDLNTPAVKLRPEFLASHPRILTLPSTPPSSSTPFLPDGNGKLSIPVPTRGTDNSKLFPGMSPGFIEHLNKKCNASQMHAISTSLLQTRGFTLIQGPPVRLLLFKYCVCIVYMNTVLIIYLYIY